MSEHTYYTIADKAEGLYREKGSRFMAFAYPVLSSDEAMEIVKQVKKEYHNARHHTFAYIIGFDQEEYRLNDDGEPSSTAGKPIHGQLLANNLTNVLVVVIRYFGGVKLGVGGLINAYRQATIDVLNNSKIIKKEVLERHSIRFDYSNMNDVMKILKEYDLKQENHQFDLESYLEFILPKNLSEKVLGEFGNIEGVKLEFISEF